MASQNGVGAGNSALYSGMNGSVMPSAGHYSDMQILMQNMETLSGYLQQNREDWFQVQEGLAKVERLQGRLGREGQTALQNGDTQSPTQDANQQSAIPQLQNDLATSQNKVASIEKLYQEQIRLQQMYDDSLSETTERIRQYCFEQQNYIKELHEHYIGLLAQSRNETIKAQLTHQAWQEGLKRLSEGLRAALKAREEEGSPWKSRIAALKEENRILRAKVGWDPPVDSDEEDEDMGDGGGGSVNASGGHEVRQFDSPVPQL